MIEVVIVMILIVDYDTRALPLLYDSRITWIFKAFVLRFIITDFTA